MAVVCESNSANQIEIDAALQQQMENCNNYLEHFSIEIASISQLMLKIARLASRQWFKIMALVSDGWQPAIERQPM
jgi:hypothetical protein